MNEKTVYLYVLDTLADWEPGYVTSELNTGRYFKEDAIRYKVQTVALTADPITTMGGVSITPDITVDALTTEQTGLLLLPGGDTWLDQKHTPIFEKVKAFLAADVPVAAICGATVGLASAGILDDRPHTSNDLDYLKAVCPFYAGEAYYQQEMAFTDGNLITGNGVAPLEFAHQVLKKLDVFSPEALEAWYKLYQTHEPQYFFKLMESIPQVEQ